MNRRLGTRPLRVVQTVISKIEHFCLITLLYVYLFLCLSGARTGGGGGGGDKVMEN